MKKIMLFIASLMILQIIPMNVLAESDAWETFITHSINGAEYYQVESTNEDGIEQSLYTTESKEGIAAPTPFSEPSLKDMLDPNRSIEVKADWGGGVLYFGDKVELTAVLNGYDNAVYTLQWQMSVDGINWVDIEGETNEHMYVVVTEENYLYYWRVEVVITDVIAAAT